MTRPRIWARRISLGLIGLIVLAALVWWLRPPPKLDCKTAAATAGEGLAVTICQQEYEQTRDPATGAELASALYMSGNYDAAEALAKDLLGTPAKADAYFVLGRVAHKRDLDETAEKWLEQARSLHRAQGNHSGIARDNQYLSLIQEDVGKLAAALQTVDDGIAEARIAHDERTEGYCHLYAARMLIHVGYFEAAHQEIDRAAQQLTGDRDQSELYRMRGDLDQESGRDPRASDHRQQAVAAFERSLEIAQRIQFSGRVLSLHLDLAYSLAEIGRTDEADRHLADAGVLDRDGKHTVHRQQLAARIAYRRKNYSLATTLNERVYPKTEDPDDKADIASMQARIALTTGDIANAVLWAKRGSDSVEEVWRTATSSSSELRPWVLASRREPLELLFTAYARAGRVEDAIRVFDQWQGRTLLDNMARPSPEPSPALSSTATWVENLERWLPRVSTAPLIARGGDAVMATLPSIDLLGLTVADGHVWRVVANHGRYALDDLGPYDNLRDVRTRFEAAPTNPALAAELGNVLLPASLLHATAEPLYVLLDASFATLPFPALRRDALPVIAIRPVLRAPRFPTTTTCSARTDKRSAVVLADAAGNLPNAQRESSEIASMFGTTPLVGNAATSTALFAARSNSLLHVAVHAEVHASGGVLKLHDRNVSAAEISANRLDPELVVLSSCSTARSEDPDLAGALSTAFLTGGSQLVVATLRPVDDSGALELTRRFYNEGGADGPEGAVRVLARVQAELARTNNQEWPKFAVYGVCVPPS